MVAIAEAGVSVLAEVVATEVGFVEDEEVVVAAAVVGVPLLRYRYSGMSFETHVLSTEGSLVRQGSQS